MKKLAIILFFVLVYSGLSGQAQDENPAFFISDYTQDGRLNDKDSIIIYLPGIFNLIEKEEWDRSEIDLSINDVSLEEITPRRFSSLAGYEVKGKSYTVNTDLLAFVIDKELISQDKLDALRHLESRSSAYVSIRLPNDAEINGALTVNRVEGSFLRLGISIGLAALITLFLFYFAFRPDSGLLRDSSRRAAQKPYSFSKSQIFWWSLVVLSSIGFVWISTSDFSMNPTAWILLGISAGTLGVGNSIDKNEIAKGVLRHQNLAGEDWFKDILKDENDSISIHRLQSFLFNLGFGIYYMIEVYTSLELPTFDSDIFALLGLSNGTYAFLKNKEN